MARRVSAPRLVADLLRKSAGLPGLVDEPRLAVCAREHVIDPTEGLLTVTARDIFA